MMLKPWTRTIRSHIGGTYKVTVHTSSSCHTIDEVMCKCEGDNAPEISRRIVNAVNFHTQLKGLLRLLIEDTDRKPKNIADAVELLSIVDKIDEQKDIL